MKFSTGTLKEMQKILIKDFREELEKEPMSPDEIEQALRNAMQEIGQGSFGEMLSMMDEHRYQTEERCTCRQMGKRVSRREAQLLSVYGRVRYKRHTIIALDVGGDGFPWMKVMIFGLVGRRG